MSALYDALEGAAGGALPQDAAGDAFVPPKAFAGKQ
jgi:hypothetical protein